jgi:aryl-alcohol dehydrogenase-like predicted oxidoreductase
LGTTPRLALGTVQFGLPYGVAGATARIPDDEARRILDFAHGRGVHMLDTAAVYGDIEERLAGLCAPATEFVVTSKIAPIPSEVLAAQDEHAVAVWIGDAIERSVARLGSRLVALLFHRAEDLDGPAGAAIWAAARRRTREHGLALGISLYEPDRLPAGCVRSELDVVQCPANVFDQRLLRPGVRDGLPGEIHVRSAFLQGLLLMSLHDVAKRLPHAVASVRRWHEWCEAHSVEPVAAALGFIKSLDVDYCVFGVDSLQQLTEVVDAWERAAPVRVPELASGEQNVIDPRTWRKAS